MSRSIAILTALALVIGLATPTRVAAQLFPGFGSPPPAEVKEPPPPRAKRPAPKAKPKAKREEPKKAKKKEPPPSKDRRVWTFGREAGFPVMAYGAPGAPMISFACQPERGDFRVIVFSLARGVKAGDSARMRLRNGPSRLEVAGTAVPGEAKGSVDIAGVTRTAPRVFSLFRTGEIIGVEVPGRTFNVPLKTLPNKAEPFERACGGRR
ncbi:MAG TPA: hypothetical protein VN930_10880 [Xanthobacteraceae bacterium]|nr:hypothetical protein [Xanthobacteraceae bacterium]